MLPKTIIHKFCIFIVVLFVSCKNEQYVWQESKSVPNCVWHKDEALVFRMPVEDTVSWFSLSVDLRNRTDYNYQNLYLFIKTKAPNGAVTVDTLNYNLANSNGSWTGSGGVFSKYKEKTHLYRKYVRFPFSGNYIVTIRQGMREDNLTGIAAVSLNYSIPKLNNKNSVLCSQ